MISTPHVRHLIAVAMFGWLVGLAWLAISVAEWLFA